MGQLGKRIQSLRQKRKLTVRALAEAIGKSPGYVSHIEVRGEIPSAEILCVLSDALRVKAELLLSLAKGDVLQQTEEKLDRNASDALARYRRFKR